MSFKRPPDMILKAFDKRSGVGSRRIGVAWVNDDGSIDIQMDLGCMLAYNPEVVGKLFKPDDENKRP